MTTELSKNINRGALATLSNNLAADKATQDRSVADIEKQIQKLVTEREEGIRQAHILAVKQRAIRTAIRVLEDEGVM
ncbi:hypothetical protein [Aminobacter phage Erebus]|nr:hypothetical protein [Aminobacter phage Erebus]